jgi:hypothetical protein
MRSIDNGDDGYPGMEDLVTNFYTSSTLGRQLEVAEEPSLVTYAWFPPVSQWPLTAEGAHCFGFRVAARDHTLVSTSNPLGEYYPSIWAYRGSDGLGYLRARVGDGFAYDVTIAQVVTTGWFTLGLSWDAAGRIEYYAAAGRRALTASDLIYTDTESDRRLESLAYHFYSIRFPAAGGTSPDFLADRCRVYTRRLPQIPTLQSLARVGTKFQMTIAGMTGGFAYRVERSATLAANSWQEVDRFTATGQPVAFEDPAAGGTALFYRVARGVETPGPAAAPAAALQGGTPLQRTAVSSQTSLLKKPRVRSRQVQPLRSSNMERKRALPRAGHSAPIPPGWE